MGLPQDDRIKNCTFLVCCLTHISKLKELRETYIKVKKIHTSCREYRKDLDRISCLIDSHKDFPFLHANESFDPHCHVYYFEAQTFFTAGSSVSYVEMSVFFKSVLLCNIHLCIILSLTTY